MKKQLYNVLITSGGGYQGLSIIKGLRKSAEIRIILTDIHSINTSKYLCDKFFISPPVKEDTLYINFLREVCHAERIDLIIPSTEFETTLLAANRDLFIQYGTKIAVSNQQALKIFSNKKNSYLFLKKNRINVLPLLDPDTHDYSFPLFGRKKKGWGSKDTIIVCKKDHIININVSEYIWQEYIQEFNEYSIDFAISFGGSISDWVIRERLRTFNGFCSVAKLVSIPTLASIVDLVIQSIRDRGGCGIFNIQFLQFNNQFVLSDINPRVGTSSVFSTDSGINLPLFMCVDDLGEAVSSANKFSSEEISHNHIMFRTLSEKWFSTFNASQIKTVIFDLDDTLFNQKKWIFYKVRELLRTTRLPIEDKNNFLIKFMQLIEEGNKSTPFTILSEELKLSIEQRKVLIKEYQSILPSGEFLFKDTLSVLHELHRRGFNLVLLTDNPTQSQQQKINATGLDLLFDAILFTRDYGLEKPDVSCFKAVAKQTGIPLEKSIMVGDNLYRDIIGAINSGCLSAFFLQRNGTLMSNDDSLFRELLTKDDKINTFLTIYDLRELLYYLDQEK